MANHNIVSQKQLLHFENVDTEYDSEVITSQYGSTMQTAVLVEGKVQSIPYIMAPGEANKSNLSNNKSIQVECPQRIIKM